MKSLKDWSESLGSSSSSVTRDNRQVVEAERQTLESADTPVAASSWHSSSDNFVAMTDSDSLLWEALNSQNVDWMCFGK
jgi:hypothetical protein